MEDHNLVARRNFFGEMKFDDANYFYEIMQLSTDKYTSMLKHIIINVYAKFIFFTAKIVFFTLKNKVQKILNIIGRCATRKPLYGINLAFPSMP